MSDFYPNSNLFMYVRLFFRYENHGDGLTYSTEDTVHRSSLHSRKIRERRVPFLPFDSRMAGNILGKSSGSVVS